MATTFEVRVEGELARPTLHSLGCPYSVAGAQTMMHIEATPSELSRLLRACDEQGLRIESVVRIG